MFRFLRRKVAAGNGSGASHGRLRIARQARAAVVSGGGIAFLHIGSGGVFTANAVGARIWQGMAEDTSLESIAVAIGRELGVPVRQVEEDARDFVAALESAGLIRREKAPQ